MNTTIGLGVGGRARGCRFVFQVITISLVSLVPTIFAQERPPIENLGASVAVVEGDWLVYSQWASFSGEDLNGHGDTEDEVVHVHKLSTGETTILRLAGAVSRVLGKSGRTPGLKGEDGGRKKKRIKEDETRCDQGGRRAESEGFTG